MKEVMKDVMTPEEKSAQRQHLARVLNHLATMSHEDMKRFIEARRARFMVATLINAVLSIVQPDSQPDSHPDSHDQDDR